MIVELTKISPQMADALRDSGEYAEYIMEFASGERIICNGDMLTQAMEDGVLWEDFLYSLGYIE